MKTEKQNLAQTRHASSKAQPPVRTAKITEDLAEANPHYRPGRASKTNVTGYFSPEVKKQLRLLAAEQGTTIQSLLAEALNGLFAAHGKPEVARLEKN